MGLPASWVDNLFARLGVRYGDSFTRQWQDADPAAVKRDWAEVLAGFEQHPDSIAYALENLPDRPPNAQQFRAICRNAPPPVVKQLPAPKADASVARAAIERLKALKSREPSAEWAAKLSERERQGDRLTAAQKSAWRAAMRVAEPSAPVDIAAVEARKAETLERVIRYAAEHGLSLDQAGSAA